MKIIETNRMVPLELIDPNPKNGYRKNEAIAKALSIDIEKRGRLLVDVTITPRNDKPDRFRYISGHQRGDAFLLLNRKEIKSTIVIFDSEDEERDAIRGYNKGRIKCEWDKAFEFSEERAKLDRKKGIRPDLTGEATGKTVDIIASEYPMKISGDQVGKYLNIWDNRKKLFDLVDEDRPNYPKISIAGADNIVAFLKERNALALTDRDMMNEVVNFIDGKLPEVEELEMAFVRAVPKLGKVLTESKKPKNSAQVQPLKENTNGNTESTHQDLQPAEKQSTPINDKVVPVSAGKTENDERTRVDNYATEQNTKGNIVTPEARIDAGEKIVTEESVDVTQKEIPQVVTPAEVSGDSQKQEPFSIKESPIEPQVLYIKNSDGTFQEYTCKHDGCPFSKRSI